MQTGRSLMEPQKPEPPDLVDRLENSILPLINLVFLLLLFFLVAGIITQHPLPPLPTQPEGAQGDRPEVQITIQSDGEIRIGSETVTLESLAGRLNVNGSEPLRVAAHAQLPMDRLEAVLESLATAGFDRVRLITRPGTGS